MSEPFEPDNDFLDMLACLGEIDHECASPRAKGTATGLIKALKYEAEHNYFRQRWFLHVLIGEVRLSPSEH